MRTAESTVVSAPHPAAPRLRMHVEMSYPYYHTALDTPDRINYDRLAHLVDGLEAVIAALAR